MLFDMKDLAVVQHMAVMSAVLGCTGKQQATLGVEVWCAECVGSCDSSTVFLWVRSLIPTELSSACKVPSHQSTSVLPDDEF